jgi:hypothetical protein
MQCRNVYGIEAPKSGGTSLWTWLRDNTSFDVKHHDSVLARGDSDEVPIPSSGQAWTGGWFWMTNILRENDPEALEILTVRKNLSDWALSFWAHMSTPKHGPGRILALNPLFGVGEVPLIQFNELDMVQHVMNIHEQYLAENVAPTMDDLDNMKELIRAYVERHIDLARDADSLDSRCLINIDSQITSPEVVKDWIARRTFPSNMFEPFTSKALEWPHERKTSQAERDETTSPEQKEEIIRMCRPYQEVWAAEVLKRVLTS